MISATETFNVVQCPHRVALDRFGNPADRDEPNAFVEMLWEQGIDHEAAIIESLGVTADMRAVPPNEREAATADAMKRGEAMIYQGRICHGDLVGQPDLLIQRGNGYIPADVKSGAGFEGDEEGALKKSYTIQIAHYVHILEGKGVSDHSREPIIIDRQGQSRAYPLMAVRGVRTPQTWWDLYLGALGETRAILSGQQPTAPALGATCKLCHWHSHCKKSVIDSNDLTLIAELGRSRRDALVGVLPTVRDLASVDVQQFIKGKKTAFPGIGIDSLRKYQARAKLLCDPNGRPYLKQPIALPVAAKEVFFDIEADPIRDFIYMHGFVTRDFGRPDTARYYAAFTEDVTAAEERRVFADAWQRLKEALPNSIIYVYSRYERTTFKRLADKYPDVCAVEEVEALFAHPQMVDLYTDVVKPATEWPTYDQSIKTLAQYLGFRWRDTHPSGAASIEWFHRYIETGDPAIKQRILDYNEDDNLASAVVADAIRGFELRAGQC